MSIEKWTDEEYFSKTEFMSVSLFKLYEKCECLGKNGFTKEPTVPMLVGSYVDSYISGTLDLFKEQHPEILLSTGKNKGELKVDFQKADEICKYIDSNRIFSQFMSGEKQIVMTGKISGVPFKIKIDSYSKGIAINDLKVMASVTDNNGNFKDFITPWGYDLQMACYQEIVFQNTGERLPVYICAVTKENPINSVIVNIPQSYLDMALYRVESAIEHFYDIHIGKIEPNGCGICDTCISLRKETPIISMEQLLGGI